MHENIYQNIDNRLIIPVKVIDYQYNNSILTLDVNRYYQEDLFGIRPGFTCSINTYVLLHTYANSFIEDVNRSINFDYNKPLNQFAVYIPSNDKSDSLIHQYTNSYKTVYLNYYQENLSDFSLWTSFSKNNTTVAYKVELTGYILVNLNDNSVYVGCKYHRKKVHNKPFYYLSTRFLYNTPDVEKIDTLELIIRSTANISNFELPIDAKVNEMVDLEGFSEDFEL